MKEKVTTCKTLLAIFGGILVLVIGLAAGGLVYLVPISDVILDVLSTLIYVAFTYWGVKLLSEKMIKLPLKECRINRPHIKAKWLFCSFALPLAVSAALLFTPGEFVHNEMSAAQVAGKVITAIIVSGLGPGIAEEMIFRGFIMKTFEKRWGIKIAILVPSVIFGLIHIIGVKMNVVDFLMLFIGGTGVGIMFSLIAYKTGSVWNSAIVHAVWNIIMIGDILSIGTAYSEDAIFSYKLLSDSLILTGGNFGVEVSIAAILGYLLVSAFILNSMKKKNKSDKKLSHPSASHT